MGGRCYCDANCYLHGRVVGIHLESHQCSLEPIRRVLLSSCSGSDCWFGSDGFQFYPLESSLWRTGDRCQLDELSSFQNPEQKVRDACELSAQDFCLLLINPKSNIRLRGWILVGLDRISLFDNTKLLNRFARSLDICEAF